MKLKAMPPGGPYVVRATVGREAIEINDVLFGDVWLCGGQSNMKYPLRMVRTRNMLSVMPKALCSSYCFPVVGVRLVTYHIAVQLLLLFPPIYPRSIYFSHSRYLYLCLSLSLCLSRSLSIYIYLSLSLSLSLFLSISFSLSLYLYLCV